MSELDDIVASHLSHEQRDELSKILGVDRGTLDRGIEHAVPVLVGGMQQSAADPQRAAGLQQAVQSHGDTSLTDLIGGMLQGSGAPGGSAGGDLLSEIFGAKRGRVEKGLGQATGMDAKTMAQLLQVLGPLLAGALAQRNRASGGEPGDLGAVLKGERERIENRSPQAKSLLAMFLDQDHDGDFDMADMLQIGMSFFAGKPKTN